MKKYIVYLAACLLVCLLPFAGMTVARTEETTENRRMAAFPEWKKDGRWNEDYLRELGAYFEDHFAFRTLLVSADSQIQSKVFRVSSMDTVVVGDDGWLYYAATLNDYLGQDLLSERGLWNIVHNLSLIRDYAEGRGASFLLTIPPNKNTLYGSHMPYYDQKKVSKKKNMTELEPMLESEGIPYADLFSALEGKEETLYLKRDSHWNQKGAVLAYHTILDALGVDHDPYETVPALRTKTEYGDLNRMLYPLGAVPEWNYAYQKEAAWHYVTDTQSVEDGWIQTANDKGDGSLLMFRDSFGNTLLPLLADVYRDACFSKGEPYLLENYMKEYHPETVIIEKVERNLCDLAQNPPIMTGPAVKLTVAGGQDGSEDAKDTKGTGADIAITESEYDPSYRVIQGTAGRRLPTIDTRIYLAVEQNGKEKTYEPFTVSEEGTDAGYRLYLPKEKLTDGRVKVSLLTETDGKVGVIKTEEFDLKGSQEP